MKKPKISNQQKAKIHRLPKIQDYETDFENKVEYLFRILSRNVNYALEKDLFLTLENKIYLDEITNNEQLLTQIHKLRVKN